MKFAKMYCSGKDRPLGTGCDVVFHWNYTGEGKRKEKQLAYRVRVWEPEGETALEELRSKNVDCRAEQEK